MRLKSVLFTLKCFKEVAVYTFLHFEDILCEWIVAHTPERRDPVRCGDELHSARMLLLPMEHRQGASLHVALYDDQDDSLYHIEWYEGESMIERATKRHPSLTGAIREYNEWG